MVDHSLFIDLHIVSASSRVSLEDPFLSLTKSKQQPNKSNQTKNQQQIMNLTSSSVSLAVIVACLAGGNVDAFTHHQQCRHSPVVNVQQQRTTFVVANNSPYTTSLFMAEGKELEDIKAAWEEAIGKAKENVAKAQKELEESGVLDELEQKVNEFDPEAALAEAKSAVDTGVKQFGEISKNVFRSIKNGEYKVVDVYLFFKTIAISGVNASPLARMFPFKVLVELLNYSLRLDVNSRLNVLIAEEIDYRLKKSVFDKKRELGAQTRMALQEFTGKEDYEAGDVLEAVQSKMKDAEDELTKFIGEVNAQNQKFEESSTIVEEFEDVDEAVEAELITSSEAPEEEEEERPSVDTIDAEVEEN